jgi:excisionase family DNA binding protein
VSFFLPNSTGLPKVELPSVPRDRALLSTEDIGILTGLHRTTIYRLMHQGRIPGVRRIGDRLFVVRSVFERWLLENQQGS